MPLPRRPTATVRPSGERTPATPLVRRRECEPSTWAIQTVVFAAFVPWRYTRWRSVGFAGVVPPPPPHAVTASSRAAAPVDALIAFLMTHPDDRTTGLRLGRGTTGSVFRHGPARDDTTRAPPARRAAARRRAPGRIRRGRAGARAGIGAGAAAAARGAPRAPGAGARSARGRGRGRPRRRRGGAVVPGRRARSAAAEPRRALGLGTRAAAASRRR